MLFFYRAYKFNSPLKLGALRDKLNQCGPFEWIDRDGDEHGDYLSAHIPEDSWLKLYEYGAGEYQIDIKFRPETVREIAERDWQALHGRVVDVWLPAMQASAVVETEVVD